MTKGASFKAEEEFGVMGRQQQPKNQGDMESRQRAPAMEVPRMLRSLLLASIAFTTAFFAPLSFASVDQTGTVSQIIPEGDNVVSVWLTGTTPTNECGGGRWTMQTDDPLFKTKMAVLLSAATTGRAITLRSTGTCGQWDSNIIYLIIVNY